MYIHTLSGSKFTQHLHLEDILGTIIDRYSFIDCTFIFHLCRKQIEKGRAKPMKRFLPKFSMPILCLSLQKKMVCGGWGLNPDTSSTHLPIPINALPRSFSLCAKMQLYVIYPRTLLFLN